MGSTKFPLIIKKLVLANLVFFYSIVGFANHDTTHASANHEAGSHAESHSGAHASGPINTPEGINAYIKHHLEDSHDFTLFTNGETNTHYGFPLLTMFFDQGFHVFSSSKFENEEARRRKTTGPKTARCSSLIEKHTRNGRRCC